MKKILLVPLSLLLGLSGISLSTSASTGPIISHLNYDAVKKSISFNAKLPKNTNNLSVKYRGKTYKYTIKNGLASVKDLHFTGYRTFSITGFKGSKKVTATTKLAKNSYATFNVVDYSIHKTNSTYSIRVTTLQNHQKVYLNYKNKPIKIANTNSGKIVNFTLSEENYKEFANNLTYTVKAPNKKIALPIKIDNIGNQTGINVIA